MSSDSECEIDRDAIRENLSHMSFEELHKLKEKIGAKLYNETVFGAPSKETTKHETNEFKRANKNRPREMSSKRPKRERKEIISVKKTVPRDPRFDPLCGTFNEEVFKKSYKFVDKIKMQEQEMLKEELKNTDDAKRHKKIKYLLQRLENQLKAKEIKEKQRHQLNEERKEIKEKLKRGEKPEFEKKSEKKITNLLNQYEDLKKTKKLNKYIKKKSKKVTTKEFKRTNAGSF